MRKGLLLTFSMMIIAGMILAFQSVWALPTYTGEVVGVYRHYIDVKKEDGRVASFRVGWRTRYYPHRQPLYGETVRVEYAYRRGANVAYTVTILSAPPPPAPPSHPVPGPVIAPETRLTGAVTVTRTRVNIRSGPGKGYPIVTRVDAGQVLGLKGRTGSWYQVYLKDQKATGWIHSTMVRVDKLKTVPGKTKGA